MESEGDVMRRKVVCREIKNGRGRRKCHKTEPETKVAVRISCLKWNHANDTFADTLEKSSVIPYNDLLIEKNR